MSANAITAGVMEKLSNATAPMPARADGTRVLSVTCCLRESFMNSATYVVSAATNQDAFFMLRGSLAVKSGARKGEAFSFQQV
jgi:hypothetical protein